MTDRIFYQEDSPWVEMKGLSWPSLTSGQVCKHFPKGYILYNQQEFCDDVFIVQHGRVAMCLCTPSGGMRIAVILNDECMFGHQTLFDQNPNSCQAQVISDEGASIYIIPKALVQEKINSDYDVIYNMLAQSNKINRMLLTQIELMSFQRSESRVCFYLMHMADQYSYQQGTQQILHLRFTHQDIADASGLSRVCVSNVISGLIKDNVLLKKAGTYMVLDIEKLRDRLNSPAAIEL
ncbi:MAG: Crp/Fnr family transcriptional regulator [Eubacteriales bacterium]|nr:Crp/Fnr family transcriptional regulator [Eubacteriales bacterium]